MTLHRYVNTYGQDLLRRHAQRVHKLALHAGFTCPNRDGKKGRGGCSFCNNASFSPGVRQKPRVAAQIAAGRAVLAKRTGARRFIAYFQAYTNTYDRVARLRHLYDQALAEPDVIGLAVGTRPDCTPEPVLALLAEYRDRGYEVWLELGLQSAFDSTLERVNRGHGFDDYRRAVIRAHQFGLPVCTHLIAGLPGEARWHVTESLLRVLELGTEGLKLHPLHVVRATVLMREWQAGAYRPLTLEEYVEIAADVIEKTPADVIFHRLTGTASPPVLVAPQWCSGKWPVLNAIEHELKRRGTRQGGGALGFAQQA